jgi:hypothetical protein
MVTSRKEKPNLKVIAGGAKSNIEDDLDALFRLPLADFIDARKALAVKLKKEGRSLDADRVKALAKPSISAWTVNQLYWRHRVVFDRLLATGPRFREAQTSSRAGKVDAMREALDARREALSHLSDLAATLLREAGHNPTLDMVRRIATTLEAMSAYTSLPDGLSAGRLTKDIDPPGFDALGSFVPEAARTRPAAEAARVKGSSRTNRGPHAGIPRGVVDREGALDLRAANKSGIAATKTPKSKPPGEASRLKEARQARLAVAKVSLQEAKKSLAEARSRAQSLEAAQKNADAEAKQAEKQKHEAETRYKAAIAASTEAAVRAQKITLDLSRATKAMEEVRGTVEKASRELELLFRQS